MRKTIILKDYLLSCEETGDSDAIWTVIFIHGACCDSRVWKKQMWVMTSGVKLLFLDLPGHGLSDGEPLGNVYEMAELVMDVAELVGDKVVLCGHSMGGAVAQTCALNYGDRVSGLILMSTGAKLKVSPEIFNDIEQGRGFGHLLYGPSTSEEKMSEANAIFSSVSAEVCYKDMEACNSFDVMEKVHLISQKTLVISGSEDLMTPPKYASFLNERIAGSNLLRVDGAGHMVMWEKPQEVNAAIRSFITQVISESVDAS